MKVFFFLFILSVNYSFAQGVANLYKDFFPAKVKINKVYLEQVSAPLTEYAKIHPELIYYYLEYLNAKYDTTSGDKYFKGNFFKIKEVYFHRYNNWLQTLQNEIEKENIDGYLKNICLDYLNDNKVETQKLVPINFAEKTDSSLMNFFIVRYYLHDPKLNYSKDIDYNKKRIQLKKNRSKVFNEMLDNPSGYEKRDLNQVLTQSYIFEDLNLANQNIKPSLIVTRVLKEYYKNKHLYGKWAVSLGFSYQRDYFTRSGNVYNTSKYSPNNIKNHFIVQPVSLSINYKLFLIPFISSLSYINFQLTAGYGVGNKNLQLEQLGYWNKNVDGVSNRSEIFDFSTNNANVKNLESLSLNVSTPVIFFGQWLSIDGGFGAAVFHTSYNITYDYSYRKFESEFAGPKILASETGSAINKKETATDLYVYPLIYIKYYIAKPFIIQFVASINELGLETVIDL